MDRITLKTGQRVRMYCKCDGHEWHHDGIRNGRQHNVVVPYSALQAAYDRRCPICGLFKWTYTKKFKGVADD